MEITEKDKIFLKRLKDQGVSKEDAYVRLQRVKQQVANTQPTPSVSLDSGAGKLRQVEAENELKTIGGQVPMGFMKGIQAGEAANDVIRSEAEQKERDRQEMLDMLNRSSRIRTAPLNPVIDVAKSAVKEGGEALLNTSEVGLELFKPFYSMDESFYPETKRGIQEHRDYLENDPMLKAQSMPQWTADLLGSLITLGVPAGYIQKAANASKLPWLANIIGQGAFGAAVSAPEDRLAAGVTAGVLTGATEAAGGVIKRAFRGGKSNPAKAEKLATEILQPSGDDVATSIKRGEPLNEVNQFVQALTGFKNNKNSKTFASLVENLKTLQKTVIDQRNSMIAKVKDAPITKKNFLNPIREYAEEIMSDPQFKKEGSQILNVLQNEEKAIKGKVLTVGEMERRKEFLGKQIQNIFGKEVPETQKVRIQALNKLRQGGKEEIERLVPPDATGKTIKELNQQWSGLNEAVDLLSAQAAKVAKNPTLVGIEKVVDKLPIVKWFLRGGRGKLEDLGAVIKAKGIEESLPQKVKQIQRAANPRQKINKVVNTGKKGLNSVIQANLKSLTDASPTKNIIDMFGSFYNTLTGQKNKKNKQ